MDVQFVDRILICSDCHTEFIFTAGEQLFFYDKEFKNDPKRCKPCKSRRSALSEAATRTGASGPAAAGLSRTETRTECSECGVQTTVPFKPTQGRPVLCRQCFQTRNKAIAAAAAAPSRLPVPSVPVGILAEEALASFGTAAALTTAATEFDGTTLSPDAAVLAAASMAAASPQSSVASAADLASISAQESITAPAGRPGIPAELIAAAAGTEGIRPELMAAADAAKA